MKRTILGLLTALAILALAPCVAAASSVAATVSPMRMAG